MKDELKYLVKLDKILKCSEIHYSQMTSWSRNGDEGFNEGLTFSRKIIDKRIKYLNKKLNLTPSTHV